MTVNADLTFIREAYLLPYQGSTRTAYLFQLDRWLNWCDAAGLPPLQAGRPDIERFIQYLQRELGHQASSVHAAMTPIRGFYRFACAEGYIDRDPAVLARR